MAVDDRTTNRNYPLPHPENNSNEDVHRLREAIGQIDEDVKAAFVGIAGKAPISHQHGMGDVTGLSDALAGKAPNDHPHALNDLTDVDVSTSTNNQVLMKVGTSWGPATLLIGHISGLQTALDGKVAKDGTSISIPMGTTAQRPADPSGPRLRYNTELSRFETWDGAAWAKLGISTAAEVSIAPISGIEASHVQGALGLLAARPIGGPSAGSNSVIRTNAATIDEDVAIPAGVNGMTAGPVTIAAGRTVTVSPGASWSIV